MIKLAMYCLSLGLVRELRTATLQKAPLEMFIIHKFAKRIQVYSVVDILIDVLPSLGSEIFIKLLCSGVPS